MADEIKDQRIITLMTPSELKLIDDWSFENRIRSRGEAIRRLCMMSIFVNRHIKAMEVSAKALTEEFSIVYSASAGKPDAERLEVYETFLSNVAAAQMQMTIDATYLEGIFERMAGGATYQEALDAVADLAKEVLRLTKRNYGQSNEDVSKE